MYYYTGKGDKGYTLIGNKAISKSNKILNAIGDIDELNSLLGLSAANIEDNQVHKIIIDLQKKLFIISSEIIGQVDKKFLPKESISKKDVKEIERIIKEYTSQIDKINYFVIPGGSISASYLQYSRSVTRRVERDIVLLQKKVQVSNNIFAFINRLSSLLFVLALFMNKKNKVDNIYI
ncbi:MAG: cob(I)yrinic acid a,c-diamide adenosyltransferase [Candidatus Micrarchaeaceae archaeon]